MDFANSTELDTARLEQLFVRYSWPYRHDKLKVRVRNSRGADFSGTCFYGRPRIFVNLGRHNRYPYVLRTQVAKSRSNDTCWWRESYRLMLTDPYQLALFVYLHEFYHYLVKQSGHNVRRKEAMCDRFATRVLVDHFGLRLTDKHGGTVPRARWDIQDLDRFVDAAPRGGLQSLLFNKPRPRPRPIPVIIRGVRSGRR